ncbi:conserved hypothetical protein [Trichinella spiralis]|uniref:hypothetical protein n=1 Tax=Trichinella spiralis TaxID=6334 RepID=UPI0001EFE309|nr:conserved hypothetical protein [Trichinella spiralis]
MNASESTKFAFIVFDSIVRLIALPYLKCWNAMDGSVLLFLRQMKSPDLKANEFFRRSQALMSSMKQKIDEHDTARLNGYPPIFCFDEQKFTFDDTHFLKILVNLFGYLLLLLQHCQKATSSSNDLTFLIGEMVSISGCFAKL